ncbi:MAG: sigma-70 family RNA polymerase sigma factor [Bryobacteraceae bacterium]|jgi:RNA polymerase sigma-70 factor (ECF subfamily)
MPEPDSVARWELVAGGKSERAPAPTGNEQEVVQLFDELRSRLMRYLLALGLPAQDGEEVIQEVFLALFQHLQRGRSRQNLRGWVFRVAHNLGLKRRLAKAREATSVLASGEALAAIRPDPAENPEERLLSNQRYQRLQSVLRALPEQDQWCLSLRAEGLRYREIAEVLDISLASVSVSLGRSLARLSRADMNHGC